MLPDRYACSAAGRMLSSCYSALLYRDLAEEKRTQKTAPGRPK